METITTEQSPYLKVSIFQISIDPTDLRVIGGSYGYGIAESNGELARS
jgi:hypothetical protein